jgi:hypothetical protein
MTRRVRDKPSRGRAKADLPQKICVACARPFVWRKKWERDWESVRYCSERCRRSKSPSGGGGP